MALNHYFWSRLFEEEFVPQLRAIVDALEMRTLPAFAGIEQEAETVSDERWTTLMSGPGTGEEDPSDFAEVAEQAGVSYYLLMNGIRQGLVNLFAVALYHTFEQQLMFFLRKELLDLYEENNSRLFEMTEVQSRFEKLGIDITAFSSWAKVDELRLLANAVKHAEGQSVQRLSQVRPDLFEAPGSAGVVPSIGKIVPRVFQPLVGLDLYVSLADLHQYRDSVIAFWKELGDAIVESYSDRQQR